MSEVRYGGPEMQMYQASRQVPRLFESPRPPTHCGSEFQPDTCRWCGCPSSMWSAPCTGQPKPKVGDTVWMKGWGGGPYLVMEEGDAEHGDEGDLGLAEVSGDKISDYDGDGAHWFVDPRCLTTEPPPAKPAPAAWVPPPEFASCHCRAPFWTPSRVIAVLGGVAAIACAVAAAMVA